MSSRKLRHVEAPVTEHSTIEGNAHTVQRSPKAFTTPMTPPCPVYCDYQLSDETLSLLWPPASFGSLSF